MNSAWMVDEKESEQDASAPELREELTWLRKRLRKRLL